MIRPAVPLLDQVVGGVGAGLPAHMADAKVAVDDRCRQLAPGLGAVAFVDGIAAHTLGRLLPPSVGTVRRRLPWHRVLVVWLKNYVDRWISAARPSIIPSSLSTTAELWPPTCHSVTSVIAGYLSLHARLFL